MTVNEPHSQSFICVTWLIHIWHASFIVDWSMSIFGRDTFVWRDSFTFCDMTHSHVWRDSFTFCDMTHSNVWCDSFKCCDMTRSHVWRDSLPVDWSLGIFGWDTFVCRDSFTFCDMTHSRVWRDSFTVDRWLRSVGSIKLQVSCAEYRLFYRALLQKRPIILSFLLTKATPYCDMIPSHVSCDSNVTVWGGFG